MLESLGLTLRVVAPDIDETRRPGEVPAAYARRLAAEKARAVAATLEAPALVLGADTTVVLGDEVLGKPGDEDDAARMLRALSGRSHEVITGIALADENVVHQQAVVTRVHFRPLTEREIAWYVATGEPFDAAGAYKIQEKGAVLVSEIEGSVTCVVGLPLAETLALLEEAGLELPWEAGPSEAER